MHCTMSRRRPFVPQTRRWCVPTVATAAMVRHPTHWRLSRERCSRGCHAWRSTWHAPATGSWWCCTRVTWRSCWAVQLAAAAAAAVPAATAAAAAQQSKPAGQERGPAMPQLMQRSSQISSRNSCHRLGTTPGLSWRRCAGRVGSEWPPRKMCCGWRCPPRNTSRLMPGRTLAR